eukprot:31044-Pelagococcus_subviridis.AAC.7
MFASSRLHIHFFSSAVRSAGAAGVTATRTSPRANGFARNGASASDGSTAYAASIEASSALSFSAAASFFAVLAFFATSTTLTAFGIARGEVARAGGSGKLSFIVVVGFEF